MSKRKESGYSDDFNDYNNDIKDMISLTPKMANQKSALADRKLEFLSKKLANLGQKYSVPMTYASGLEQAFYDEILSGKKGVPSRPKVILNNEIDKIKHFLHEIQAKEDLKHIKINDPTLKNVVHKGDNSVIIEKSGRNCDIMQSGSEGGVSNKHKTNEQASGRHFILDLY
jgi:hypothetical protein